MTRRDVLAELDAGVRPSGTVPAGALGSSWPSKGIETYALASAPGSKITLQKPTNWGKGIKNLPVGETASIVRTNLQISECDIGLTEHTGRYRWTAETQSSSIASHFAEISPATGNLGRSDLYDMLETPSRTGPGWALSYGFYDSGPGIGGLTNQDQSYIYLTDSQATWMGDLVRLSGGVSADTSFQSFVLPGAHDSGMFDLSAVRSILKDPARLLPFLARLAAETNLALTVVERLGAPEILRTVINLAFTQKDTISTMLDLGVRYLDFRPGYTYLSNDTTLLHQHNFIPGYPYRSMLVDVLQWLAAHPSEIVVISPNFQGFQNVAMKPAPSVLAGVLADALDSSAQAGHISVGDKRDLSRPYSELVASNTRLIILAQVGDPGDASKYDSYLPGNYTTVDPNNILVALGKMSSAAEQNHDYTVAQLQGTASGIGGGIFTSIATISDASSPLMSTKAAFDFVTYPWVQQNLVRNLSGNKLLVLLNDFCDNALAAVAAAMTVARTSQHG